MLWTPLLREKREFESLWEKNIAEKWKKTREFALQCLWLFPPFLLKFRLKGHKLHKNCNFTQKFFFKRDAESFCERSERKRVNLHSTASDLNFFRSFLHINRINEKNPTKNLSKKSENCFLHFLLFFSKRIFLKIACYVVAEIV